MELCNDHFWSYTTEIIVKYKVRWIEAAIVSPVWTSVLVYYVEGDRGHLMNEVVGQQRDRTVVRGGCMSFQMPWEAILEELEDNCLEHAFEELPRSQECLKYVLRVHPNVAGQDFSKYLKQVQLRPFMLLKLLEYLIDYKREVFRDHLSAQVLKANMAAAVERHYPEREGDLPEESREGFVPGFILDSIQRQQRLEEARERNKRTRLTEEKQATPGTGGRTAEASLHEVRPFSITNSVSTSAASESPSIREGARNKREDL